MKLCFNAFVVMAKL